MNLRELLDKRNASNPDTQATKSDFKTILNNARKAEGLAKSESAPMAHSVQSKPTTIGDLLKARLAHPTDTSLASVPTAHTPVTTASPARKPNPFANKQTVTVAEVKQAIQEEKKKLSFAELLALKKQTQEQIAEELAEAEFDNLSKETSAEVRALEPTGLTVATIPDTKLQPNIKETIKESLQERIARMKAEKERQAQTVEIIEPKEAVEQVAMDEKPIPKAVSFALDIKLNIEQQTAVDYILQGKSFCLIGPAGTGKTTSERGMCKALIENDMLGVTNFKVSAQERIDAPSIAIVAYTRRAASNSAKAILSDPTLAQVLSRNIMTIHALLEFEPITYLDQTDGQEKFRFVPMKTANNPLSITHLIIEESTLVGLDLWEMLFDALPAGVQIILVGDINQLPPVFGPSILNYGLTFLPVVELVQIYRQAEGSPIIYNAHRILRGESIQPMHNEQGSVTIMAGKNEKQVGQTKTAYALAKSFQALLEAGQYNPDEDMILSPYNVQDLGTINMNLHIAEFLAIKNNLEVFEIIVGFRKIYLAVGDKVMCNKRDAVITDIKINRAYSGKQPQPSSKDLSRWGVLRTGAPLSLADIEDGEVLEGDIDYSSFSIDSMMEDKERKMQSSHAVTITYENGFSETLTAVGDLSDPTFALGYVLTCHKAQGSEWNRVYVIMHQDHIRSLSREWLYTAMTRARTHTILIAKPYVLDKAIAIQRVKGNTLKDKIEYFNSGVQEVGTISFTKQ